MHAQRQTDRDRRSRSGVVEGERWNQIASSSTPEARKIARRRWRKGVTPNDRVSLITGPVRASLMRRGADPQLGVNPSTGAVQTATTRRAVPCPPGPHRVHPRAKVVGASRNRVAPFPSRPFASGRLRRQMVSKPILNRQSQGELFDEASEVGIVASKSTFPIDVRKLGDEWAYITIQRGFQVDSFCRPSQETIQYSLGHLLRMTLLRAMPAKTPPRDCARTRRGCRSKQSRNSISSIPETSPASSSSAPVRRSETPAHAHSPNASRTSDARHPTLPPCADPAPDSRENSRA